MLLKSLVVLKRAVYTFCVPQKNDMRVREFSFLGWNILLM